MSEPTPEALMFARIWLANDPSKKGEDELAGVLDRFAAAAVERERERCAAIADIWMQSEAGANSTNLGIAKAMATVTRYASEKIKEAILSGEQP